MLPTKYQSHVEQNKVDLDTYPNLGQGNVRGGPSELKCFVHHAYLSKHQVRQAARERETEDDKERPTPFIWFYSIMYVD